MLQNIIVIYGESLRSTYQNMLLRIKDVTVTRNSASCLSFLIRYWIMWQIRHLVVWRVNLTSSKELIRFFFFLNKLLFSKDHWPVVTSTSIFICSSTAHCCRLLLNIRPLTGELCTDLHSCWWLLQLYMWNILQTNLQPLAPLTWSQWIKVHVRFSIRKGVLWARWLRTGER